MRLSCRQVDGEAQKTALPCYGKRRFVKLYSLANRVTGIKICWEIHCSSTWSHFGRNTGTFLFLSTGALRFRMCPWLCKATFCPMPNVIRDPRTQSSVPSICSSSSCHPGSAVRLNCSVLQNPTFQASSWRWGGRGGSPETSTCRFQARFASTAKVDGSRPAKVFRRLLGC